MGIVIVLVAGRWLSPLLLGVGPRDPAVTLGVVLALAMTAIVAGLVPAWRASRVHPADAEKARPRNRETLHLSGEPAPPGDY